MAGESAGTPVDASMTGKLLDTTVLIDLSRGNVKAADFVDPALADETPLYVSVISAMELIVGCRDKGEVEKAKNLIADFALVQVSPVASAQAYELVLTYSKSHGLTIPDALNCRYCNHPGS
ncbi:MAG TPA: VapC toxin family PIN domain ribonuclease [Chloroflexi bacterium]|nr:VapC toxin family PIN domain ribonuclease [Chloroflexota bacterium]